LACCLAQTMDTLDESWVEKKLMAATNTQESVQSLSMWALHHKTQHEKIVAIWFKVLKMGKYGYVKICR